MKSKIKFTLKKDASSYWKSVIEPLIAQGDTAKLLFETESNLAWQSICTVFLKFAINAAIDSFPSFKTKSTLLSQTRLLYGIKSKAAISLTFDLHCTAIAALFFIIHIFILFENIASQLMLYLSPSLQVLPIYMHIRTLVASYLFLTAYGQFYSSWVKKQFGIVRVFTVSIMTF